MELKTKVIKQFTYDKNGIKLEFSLELGTRQVRDFLDCLEAAIVDIKKELE